MIPPIIQEILSTINAQNLEDSSSSDPKRALLLETLANQLNLIPRHEFDAQSAVLKSTQEKVAQLKIEIDNLKQQLDTNN